MGTTPPMNDPLELDAAAAAAAVKARRRSEQPDEQRGQFLSGGPINAVVDIFRAGEYAVGGLLSGKGVRRGIAERTESAPEFRRRLVQAGLPDNSATRLAAFAASLVVDPTNLVGMGLTGKALRSVGAVRAAEIADTAIPRAAATVGRAAESLLGRVAPRLARVREARKALEPILDYQVRAEAKGIERSVDLARSIRQDALAISRHPVGAKQLDQSLGAYFDAGADAMLDHIVKVQEQARQAAAQARKMAYASARQAVASISKAVRTPEEARAIARQAREHLAEARRVAREAEQAARTVSAETIAAAREAGKRSQEAFLQTLPEGTRAFVQKWAPIVVQQDADLLSHLVRVGLLKPATAEKWAGFHLRRIYQRFEDPHAFVRFLEQTDPVEAARLLSRLERGAPVRQAGRLIPVSVAKPRKALSEETRRALGEIPDASSRIAIGGALSSRAIARGEAYAKVAQQFAVSEEVVRATPDAARLFRQMPDTPGWGQLAGKWLPKEIADPLLEAVRRPEGVEAVLEKLTGWFKFSKTILNPATHFRNLRTNISLVHNAVGLGGLRPGVWKQALEEVLTNGPRFREAKGVSSAFIDTFTQAELREFALNPNERGLIGFFRRGAATLARAYQIEEQVGKMAVYLTARGRGMSPEAAAKVAELALFNYRKVPPLVDRMRRIGIYPFLTFPYKVATETLPLAIKRPGRFAMQTKIIQGVGEPLTPNEERVLPVWMRGGGWIKLPIRINGHPVLYDLTYELPWGDIGESGTPASAVVQLVRRVRAGESLDSALRELSPFLTPAGQVMAEILLNRSAFQGREIYEKEAPPARQATQAAQHLLRFAAPSVISKTVLPGGELRRALEGAIPGGRSGVTPGGMPPPMVPQAVASTVFGLKTRTLDVEQERIRRAIELRQAIADIRQQMARVVANRALSTEEKRQQLQDLSRRMQTIMRRFRETGTVEVP